MPVKLQSAGAVGFDMKHAIPYITQAEPSCGPFAFIVLYLQLKWCIQQD